MPNRADDPDFSLVCASQKGDKAAFENLVAKYQNRIFNMLLRFISDYEMALDLSQETFLRAYQSLGSFKGESAFFTWLFRIALNVAKSKRRQVIRMPKRISLSFSKTTEAPLDFPGHEPSPDAHLIATEMQSSLQTAISSLPDEFRQAFILRDLQDLSYEEIQTILHCPIGTVRSRIHRARALLREKLSPVVEENAFQK